MSSVHVSGVDTVAGVPRRELEAAMKPFGQASVLPFRCYTDEAFFAHERETVFMRHWLPVGRVDQVANPGEYFTITRFGEPVLVVRDKAGTLRALSNVCRHRGHIVATGAGKCRANRFVCNYHGWTFDTTGALASAPFMQDTPGFDLKDWRLPELGIDTWQGWIFINFDKNAPLLSPQLKTVDQVLAPLQLERMKTAPFRLDVDWPGNWKATLDNFTEAYHQPLVHPATFEKWAPAKNATYDDVDGPYNLFWMGSTDGGPLPTFFDPIPGLPERIQREFIVINVFPYFHVLVDPSCVISLDFDIRGANDHRCSWWLHVTPESHAQRDFEARKQQLYDAILAVWNEDQRACTAVNTGQRSRFAQAGRLSWMEKSVHQLHSWLARQYCS